MTRRLFPNSAEMTIEQAYDAPLGALSDRPWVGLCMVNSIDGSTVVDGRSTELSSATTWLSYWVFVVSPTSSLSAPALFEVRGMARPTSWINALAW